MDSIDPKVREIVLRHLAAEPNSRAAKALRAMLEKGSVTTADLNGLGYDHPPRAIGDVRDAGIPVVTEMVRADNGKRMARYRLGRAEDIRDNRHGGRSVLPKAFKAKLLARYGLRRSHYRCEARRPRPPNRPPHPVPGRRGRRLGRPGC